MVKPRKPLEALVGERFGGLVVIYRLSRWKRRRRYFCLCDCGKTSVVTDNNLKTGNSKSCGCKKHYSAMTHNHCGTAIIRVWDDMKARCYRVSHKSYHNYGGRGISVCEGWKNNSKGFIEWAYKNGWERGLQLDRVDNDKGYYPDNCRFVSRYKNIHNRREFRDRNKTGYVGVSQPATGCTRFVAQISDKYLTGGKIKHIGVYPTAWEACQARNKFIKENNLPHKLQEEL